MNSFYLSFVVGILVVVAVFGAPKTFEENLEILKKVDVDAVIKNDRIMRNYIDCVLDKKTCTPEGTAFKESWKEGLERGCGDCDEETNRIVKKLVKHVYVNKRNWYDELVEALDKDKKYSKKYETYINDILKDTSI
nr:chemosensory protein 3 [Ophraella communa]